MTLRGNLFIKIFIAFWLVTISILGSWMLSSHYFESQPPQRELSGSTITELPHRFLLPIIYNLQNLEDEALAMAVDDVRTRHEVEIYLVDNDNTDLLGRKIPHAVQRVARKLSGRSPPCFS